MRIATMNSFLVMIIFVCLYLSSTSSAIETNATYGHLFFNFAKAYAYSNESHTLPRVHLIRIPKASSSSLSAIARRMVGCTPPGPCCLFPGDPKGSCPSKELIACEYHKKVIGCTNHLPNIKYLEVKTIPSIS